MNQTSSEEGGRVWREGRVWSRYAVEGPRHHTAHTAAGLAWVVGPIYLTLFSTLL